MWSESRLTAAGEPAARETEASRAATLTVGVLGTPAIRIRAALERRAEVALHLADGRTPVREEDRYRPHQRPAPADLVW
jgi:hypothetical protein